MNWIWGLDDDERFSGHRLRGLRNICGCYEGRRQQLSLEGISSIDLKIHCSSIQTQNISITQRKVRLHWMEFDKRGCTNCFPYSNFKPRGLKLFGPGINFHDKYNCKYKYEYHYKYKYKYKHTLQQGGCLAWDDSSLQPRRCGRDHWICSGQGHQVAIL